MCIFCPTDRTQLLIILVFDVYMKENLKFRFVSLSLINYGNVSNISVNEVEFCALSFTNFYFTIFCLGC